MSERHCWDCKHHIKWLDVPRGETTTQCRVRSFSLVTGKYGQAHGFCGRERSGQSIVDWLMRRERCGPEGRFFERGEGKTLHCGRAVVWDEGSQKWVRKPPHNAVTA